MCNTDRDRNLTDDDLKHLKLKRVDINERWIKLYEVTQDTSLKEFIEGEGLIFKRGCAFYEFTHSVESIMAESDKEFLFVPKVI